MQEDVENKTIMLMINGSKFTGRKLIQASAKLLAHLKNHRHKDVVPHGKQTVRQLLQKDQGAASLELNDPNMKAFERIARKYGVDYAIRQVRGEHPKFLVFFKARDNDAITAVLTELTNKKMKREKEPAAKDLTQFKEKQEHHRPARKQKKELSR